MKTKQEIKDKILFRLKTNIDTKKVYTKLSDYIKYHTANVCVSYDVDLNLRNEIYKELLEEFEVKDKEKLEFKKEMSKQALLEVIGLDEFQLERLIENKEMVIRELNKLEDLSMEYFEKEFDKLGFALRGKLQKEYMLLDKDDGFHLFDISKNTITNIYASVNNETIDLIRKFQNWYWSDK